MTDPWTDRLSDYIDGDLSAADRTALEAHLADCASCAGTLADLRRVVSRARALEDRPPANDFWPAVAARIGVKRAPRRFTFSLPQLAAAGIALTAFSSAAGWMLHRDSQTTPRVAAGAPAPSPATGMPVHRAVAGTYDAAVADLEQVLAEGRDRLDTATVRVLEQNLATIDRAITQAQRAVAADSGNLYLNSHLAATMRRKLELLRQAAALVVAES